VRRLTLLLGLLAGLLAGAPGPAHAHGDTDHRDTPAELRALDLAQAVDAAEDALRPQASTADGLPTRWCGTPRTTDAVAGAPVAPTLPQFKFVYAHVAGDDRHAIWADDLQATASLIQRYLGAQTGGRKALRLDMGTGCGDAYVDVLRVQLGQPRSYYQGHPDRFGAVSGEVWAALGSSGGPRNVVILADGLLAPGQSPFGEGEMLPGEQAPGSENRHNAGGLTSALWTRAGETPDGDGWWPTGFLHEITHNLGSVFSSAPHATAHGHCWDGLDVMCYADGPGSAEQQRVCEAVAGALTRTFDCGGDDYFNPAPPAGSYLATHWNTYDSAFLAACGTLAAACGTPSGAALPVNTVSPAVSGAVVPGATLAVTPGRWLGGPRFAYQWQREAGGRWVDLPGATGAQYAVGAADAGVRLRARVLATNTAGTGAADSLATGTAPGAASPPPAAGAAKPVPRIAGTATLRPVRGKGLGTVRFTLAKGVVRAAPAPVRLARGAYEARVCARAAGQRERCTRRRLRVTRTGRVALPVLRIRVAAKGTVRVSYAVRRTGARFTASARGVQLRP